MATTDPLRPSADYSPVWSPDAEDHYSLVNDASDSTSIAATPSYVGGLDLYYMADMPAASAITSVTLYARAKDSGNGTNTIALACSDGVNTALLQSPVFAPSTSIAETSYAFANHPDGSAWGTAARVNACYFGVKCVACANSRQINVYDVWLVVVYTAAAEPIVVTPAAATLVTASVTPTVALGSVAITPAAATCVCATVDPMVPGIVVPAPSTMVCAIVAPTVVLSSVVITPDASTLVCATVAPITAIVISSLISTLVAATIAPIIIMTSVAKTPSPSTLVTHTVTPTVLIKRKGAWTNPATTFRRKLTFRTDHPEIPADYTASFNMPTGTRYKIANDGCFNQAIREPSNQVLYANGKTHVCYLSHISDVDGMYGVSIQSYDHLTQQWGTPYRVDSAQSSSDPHTCPHMVRDNAGYLHLFYGAHVGPLCHSVSNAPDESGALPGETSGWTLKGIVTGGGSNYEYVDLPTANDQIYIFASVESKKDTYGLAATALGSGDTISKVTVKIRAKGYQSEVQAVLKAIVRPGSTDRLGAGFQVTNSTSFVVYSTDWTTNPDTSATWLYSELDSLQAGVITYTAAHEIEISQLWVEVTHGGDVEILRPNAAGSTTQWSRSSRSSYPIPICDQDSGLLFVFFRGSGEAGGSFIYSADAGLTWSSEKAVVYDAASSPYTVYRLYFNGIYYDQIAKRIHVAFSFIDTGNFTRGVWYAYSDLESGTAPYFISWKTIDGSGCGTTHTSPITRATLAAGTGKGVVIANSGDGSMTYFIRYVTLLRDGTPVVAFLEANGLRGVYDNCGFGVSRYYSGAWHHTSISEAHDITIHDALDPMICDRDGVLHMFTGEDSRCIKHHVPTGNGDYTDSTGYGSGTALYEFVDDGIHNMDWDTSYLAKTGAVQKCTFTSNKTLPNGVKILRVGVETVTRRSFGQGTTTYKHLLRIGGVDYEGAAILVPNGLYAIYRTWWDTNPATSAAWTKAAVEAAEFGFSESDTTEDTVVRTSRCNLIIEVNYASNDELWGQEIVHLASADNGDTWVANRISENSSVGMAMMGGKMYYSNDQLGIVWSSGYDVFYYTNEPYGLIRHDARDLRIRWGSTEIHRIVDYANFENTRIRFKLQEVLSAGAVSGTIPYYLEYGNPNETTDPLSNPNEVLLAFESFETYDNAEAIAGQRDWTLNSGTAVGYYSGAVQEGNKVHAGATSMKCSATSGVIDVKKSLPTTYSDIHVRAAIWMEAANTQWVSLCDSGGDEFGAGKTAGSGHWDAGYYDGTFHAHATHRAGKNAYDIVEAQITSKGGSAWVNGNLIADEVSTPNISAANSIKCRTNGYGLCYFDTIEVSRRLRKSGGVNDYQVIGPLDGNIDPEVLIWYGALLLGDPTDHSATYESWCDGKYDDIYYDDAVNFLGVGRIDVKVRTTLNESGAAEQGKTCDYHVWLSRGSVYDPLNIVADETRQMVLATWGTPVDEVYSFTGLLGGHYSVKVDFYASNEATPHEDIDSLIYEIKVYGYSLDPVIILGEQEVKGFYIDASILGGRQLLLTIDATIDGYVFLCTPAPATLVAASVAPTVGFRGITSAATLVAASVDPVAILGSIAITPSAGTLVAASVAPTIVLTSVAVTPDASTLVAATVDPTAILGSLSIIPAVSTLVTASVDPAVILGSVAVTPDVATLVTASVTPAVVLGSVVVTPAAGTLVAASVAPTPILGSMAITPTPATLVTTSIAPSVTLTITPTAATLVCHSVVPTVALAITPNAATLICSSVTPIVGLRITPTAATLIASTVDPTTVLGSVAITPTASTLIAATVDPITVLGSLAITPAASSLITGSIAPTTVLGSLAITPAASSLVAATIDPVAVFGSIAITPSAASLVTATTGCIVQGNSVAITPSPATSVVATVDPTAVLGSIGATPSAATLVAGTVAPTCLLSSVTITPNPVTLIAASVTPTVILGSLSITPPVATLVCGKVDPTVILGSLALTPAVGSLVTAVIAPSVVLGSLAITPAAATLVTASVDPTVDIVTGTIIPTPATCVTATVAPTVILGSLAITPTTASLVAASVAPTVVQGSVAVTPSVSTLVAQSIAPTVVLGSRAITPTAVSAVVATVTPAVVLGSLSVTPSAATLVTATVDPSLSFGGVALTPSPASLIAATVAPTFTLTSATIVPAAATAVLAVIPPTVILGSFSITPAAATLVTATVDPTYLFDAVFLTPAPVTLVAATIDPVLILTSATVTPSAGTLICATVAPTVTLWHPTFTSPRIVSPTIKTGSLTGVTVKTNAISGATIKQPTITNLDIKG